MKIPKNKFLISPCRDSENFVYDVPFTAKYTTTPFLSPISPFSAMKMLPTQPRARLDPKCKEVAHHYHAQKETFVSEH